MLNYILIMNFKLTKLKIILTILICILLILGFRIMSLGIRCGICPINSDKNCIDWGFISVINLCRCNCLHLYEALLSWLLIIVPAGLFYIIYSLFQKKAI